jgi:hypothetical protein
MVPRVHQHCTRIPFEMMPSSEFPLDAKEITAKQSERFYQFDVVATLADCQLY